MFLFYNSQAVNVFIMLCSDRATFLQIDKGVQSLFYGFCTMRKITRNERPLLPLPLAGLSWKVYCIPPNAKGSYGIGVSSTCSRYNKKRLIKKSIPRSKWIILRGLETNQIKCQYFYIFFKILTIQKRKIYF